MLRARVREQTLVTLMQNNLVEQSVESDDIVVLIQTPFEPSDVSSYSHSVLTMSCVKHGVLVKNT